jgi:hypothetical protein
MVINLCLALYIYSTVIQCFMLLYSTSVCSTVTLTLVQEQVTVVRLDYIKESIQTKKSFAAPPITSEIHHKHRT